MADWEVRASCAGIGTRVKLLSMGKHVTAIALILLSGPAWAQSGIFRRTMPCKTYAAADVCYSTQGRLTFCCGTPAVRLWKIGTHRVLGIFSGPEAYNATRGEIVNGDNEHPELPKNVDDLAMNFRARSKDKSLPGIYGDFEVCPLEPERPRHMQAACI